MHSIYIKYTSHSHKQVMKSGAALVNTISSSNKVIFFRLNRRRASFQHNMEGFIWVT